MTETTYPPAGHPASVEQRELQQEWLAVSLAVGTFEPDPCPHPALQLEDSAPGKPGGLEWWCVECDAEPDLCARCGEPHDAPGDFCPDCLADLEDEDWEYDEPDDRDRLGREWHEDRYPFWYEEEAW